MEQMTYWLSFANEDEFGGVVIVDLSDIEIGSRSWIEAAVRKTTDLGVNPGTKYSVRGQRLRPPDAIPDHFKNRLLSEAEVDMLNSRMKQ
jgi:hypothetical protein